MPQKVQLIFKNGDRYYGHILKENKQMHGHGAYKFANGSTYEGEFVNGQFEGHGKLWDQFNSITIIGSFMQGSANGHVKIIYSDQSLYEGEVKKGVRSGKGLYIYPTHAEQKEYEGEFSDDAYEGRGALRFKAQGKKYIGAFHKGQFHGEGEFYSESLVIKGDFQKGIPHGKCSINYLSLNEAYEGQVNEGLKSGYGVYTYSDKSQYIGNFKGDLKSGRGKFVFANGQSFNGEFANDEPISGVLSSMGWQIDSHFVNGELNGACLIQKTQSTNSGVAIQGNYNSGQKEGMFSVKKVNSKGNQVSYKGQFSKGREKPFSVRYSQRF